MSSPLAQARIDSIQQLDAEQRFTYLVKEVVTNRELWILTDEHGCVMLNTDDEDCVPVWPNREFAEMWATGDWDHCKAQAISLDKWHRRWTPGLEDDGLAVVIFPHEGQDGLVLFPDELDVELKKQTKKQKG